MHSYQELTGTFGESPMITKMYYLPTKESRISNILKTGFLQEGYFYNYLDNISLLLILIVCIKCSIYLYIKL